MNNALLILAMILSSIVLLLVFLSHFGTIHKINIGKNSALGKKAAIRFLNNGGCFNIKKWDGIDIEKDLYKEVPMHNDKTELKVPPGNNSIAFDVHFSSGKYVYTIKNIELQYYLLPGRKYTVKTCSKSLDDHQRRTFSIQLRTDNGKKELLKEWEITEAA